jgi:hypothetical protein
MSTALRVILNVSAAMALALGVALPGAVQAQDTATSGNTLKSSGKPGRTLADRRAATDAAAKKTATKKAEQKQ